MKEISIWKSSQIVVVLNLILYLYISNHNISVYNYNTENKMTSNLWNLNTNFVNILCVFLHMLQQVKFEQCFIVTQVTEVVIFLNMNCLNMFLNVCKKLVTVWTLCGLGFRVYLTNLTKQLQQKLWCKTTDLPNFHRFSMFWPHVHL